MKDACLELVAKQEGRKGDYSPFQTVDKVRGFRLGFFVNKSWGTLYFRDSSALL